MNENETIAAISTPMAEGGIGIIRLSGRGAVTIAEKIFSSPKGKKLTMQKTHTLTYGDIINPQNNQVIDECLVGVMLAPHTYTGENVCEINCHGGLYVCDKILCLCLEQGATLAEPGEFTKRAFLNGRMDLSRAEAVIDVISAQSIEANRIAVGQLKGQMGRKISQLREKLIRLCGDILVEVEYPEDGAPLLEEYKAYITLQKIEQEITKLYRSFQAGSVIKDGIETVIVGKPNVGKSSILNLLAGFDKAIVTEIEGTTRDVIEEKIRLGSVILNLKDTAGIRQTTDKVEKIGVEKSNQLLEEGQLVFYVVDASKTLDENDKSIIKKLEEKRTIVIFNKTDLQKSADEEYIKGIFKNVVYMSALEQTGLEELEQLIEKMFMRAAEGLATGEIVTNKRQRECLRKAKSSIETAITGLKGGFTFDIVSIDLEDAITFLGEITGQTASEDIISDIFARFCLGK